MCGRFSLQFFKSLWQLCNFDWQYYYTTCWARLLFRTETTTQSFVISLADPTLVKRWDKVFFFQFQKLWAIPWKVKCQIDIPLLDIVSSTKFPSFKFDPSPPCPPSEKQNTNMPRPLWSTTLYTCSRGIVQ